MARSNRTKRPPQRHSQVSWRWLWSATANHANYSDVTGEGHKVSAPLSATSFHTYLNFLVLLSELGVIVIDIQDYQMKQTWILPLWSLLVVGRKADSLILVISDLHSTKVAFTHINCCWTCTARWNWSKFKQKHGLLLVVVKVSVWWCSAFVSVFRKSCHTYFTF